MILILSRTFLFYLAVISFYACSFKSIDHNLMVLYRKMFSFVRYNYAHFSDENYFKEATYSSKIICDKKYLTKSMKDSLNNMEETLINHLSWKDNERTGGILEIDGVKVVVKKISVDGFFSNMFRMPAPIYVWNMVDELTKKGFHVLKPIAIVEKRSLFKATGYIVYKFEGTVLTKNLVVQKGLKEKIHSFHESLLKAKITHHDFHLRNIVMLEDNTLQLIDLDKTHWYPKYSLFFQKKANVEKRRLKKEI